MPLKIHHAKQGLYKWRWSQLNNLYDQKCYEEIVGECGDQLNAQTGETVPYAGEPVSRLIAPKQWRWSAVGELDVETDTQGNQCYEIKECGCGEILETQTGECIVDPAVSPAKQEIPGADFKIKWKWSSTGDLDAEGCVEIKECPCGEDLDIQTGQCVQKATTPAAKETAPYHWDWSPVGDLARAQCYFPRNHECQDIEIATGGPKALPNNPSSERVGEQNYLWSQIGDLERCAEHITCSNCGTRLENETGSCDIKISDYTEHTTWKAFPGQKPDKGDEILVAKNSDYNVQACVERVPFDACVHGPDTKFGNPIDCAIGAKLQTAELAPTVGKDGLSFKLRYRSLGTGKRPLSASELGAIGGWQIAGTAKLIEVIPGQLLAIQIAGRQQWVYEIKADGQYRSIQSNFGIVTQIASGWELVRPSGTVMTFNTDGNLTKRHSSGGRQLNYQYETLAVAGSRLVQINDQDGRHIDLNYGTNGQLVTVTDSLGLDYQLSYNSNNMLEQVIYPDASIHRYEYSNTDFPYALTTRSVDGLVIGHYAYDEAGYAISTEGGNGENKVSFEYLDNVQIVVNFHIDAASVDRRVYTIDAHGGAPGVSEIRYAPCDGCPEVTEQYDYNENGYLVSATDAAGIETRYERDERGNATERTEAATQPEARSVTIQWHPQYRLPLLIEEPRLIRRYTYDEAGRRLTETLEDKSSAEQRTTTWTYDTNGNVLSVDGPRNDVADITTYVYDSNNNLVSVTNALGHQQQFLLHDAAGRPLSIIDANNISTTLSYDSRGRILARSVANSSTSYQYDGRGNLIRTTDSTGIWTEYEYDSSSRLIAISNAEGEIRYTLDARGNRTSSHATGNNGELYRQSQQTFDLLGRLHSVLSGGGIQEVYQYDINGNLTGSTLGGTDTTTHNYDALNRLIQSTDPAGGVTQYAYDAAGNLITVEAPNGATTQYQYNGFAEVIKETSPDRGVTSYRYDSAGNRTIEIDARRIKTQFSYDAINRLIAINKDISLAAELDPVSLPEQLGLQYHYDGLNDLPTLNGVGRLTGITGNLNSVMYRYDERGNRIEEQRMIGTEAYRVGYEYDTADRLTKLIYPSGRHVDYPRDALGRIASISTRMPNDLDNGLTSLFVADQIQYEPIPGGQWTQLTVVSDLGPNNLYASNNKLLISLLTRQWTRDYDLDGRLLVQGQDHSELLLNINNGTNALENDLYRHYQYNNKGQLIAIRDASRNLVGQNGLVDSDEIHSSANSGQEAYTYDSVGRLNNASGRYGSYQYHYDTNGNRQSRLHDDPVEDADNVLESYLYRPNSNQLSSVATPGQTQTYVYDANGNPTQAGNLYSVYDHWNRHTVALNTDPTNPQAVVQHYSPEGWRDLKLGGGKLSSFIHDQNGLLLSESNMLADTANSGVNLLRTQADEAINTLVLPVVAEMPSIINPLLQSAEGQVDLVTGQALQLSQSLIATSPALLDLGYTTGEDSIDLVINEAQWRLKPASREYIYFNGIPIGLITNRSEHSVQELFFLQTDHLGTPRRATDILGLPVWWPIHTPFGEQYQESRPQMKDLMAAIDQSLADVIAEINGEEPPEQNPDINQGFNVDGELLYSYYVDVLGLELAEYSVATAQHEERNLADLLQITQPLRFPGQYDEPETRLHYNYHRFYDPTTGRYIQSDPIGLRGGINTYLYSRANPIRYIDPLGLETTVVTVRDFGVGSHSAVHVDNGGYGQPALYDPAGSYVPPSTTPRGSGDLFEGPDASLDAYKKYHEDSGSTVETTTLPTTPAQEAEIMRRAEEMGGGTGGLCTVMTSAAIGGACGIDRFILPGSLADDAKEARCE